MKIIIDEDELYPYFTLHTGIQDAYGVVVEMDDKFVQYARELDAEWRQVQVKLGEIYDRNRQ